MSTPTLYVFELSPPARAVRMLANYIKLELDVQNLDFAKGEQLEEPFVKLNPQHTVPTLVDDGESIWDSHAICAYLVGKYAQDDSLYPRDLLTRARIDQRLHFDNGVLFPAMRAALHSFMGGETELSDAHVKAIRDGYDMLEIFLADGSHLVGDTLTIADICIVLTVSAMQMLVPIDPEAHEKMLAWMELLSNEIPSYEQHVVETTEKFKQFLGIAEC